MKALNPKRILIILLFCCFIFAMGSVQYYTFMDIKERNEHTSALTQESTSEVERQQYVISLRKTVEDVSVDIARLNNSFVKSEENVAFIENLEAIAKEYGLSFSIDSLTVDDDPLLNSAGMIILQVKAKTEGNWLGTYKFLLRLESLPTKIKINKFGIAGVRSDTQVAGKKIKTEVLWHSAFEINVLKYK